MMPVEITKVVEQVGDAPAIGEARSKFGRSTGFHKLTSANTNRDFTIIDP